MRMIRIVVLASAALAPAWLSLGAPAVAQMQDNSIERAAMSPLRDARIKEDKIPDVLLLAVSAPYSSANTRTCAMIAGEVNKLTAVLGQDVDAPAARKGQAAEIAAAATRGVVSSFIPGLGLVRVITGADKAQRRAEAAVYAGAIRRGYLKGLGLSKGCKPVAAPRAAAIADRPELPPIEKDDDDKK